MLIRIAATLFRAPSWLVYAVVLKCACIVLHSVPQTLTFENRYINGHLAPPSPHFLPLSTKQNAGGDSIKAYAKGPSGLVFHGSVIDTGDGNYTVSSWPVVAGGYQMSVLVSALEPSRWALGYRWESL